MASPSLWDLIANDIGLNDAYDTVTETGKTVGSGMLSSTAGGLLGLTAMPFVGAENAANVVRNIQDKYTYQPKTSAGIKSIENVGAAFAPVEDGKKWLGDITLDATGSPALATAAYIVPDTLMSLIGAKSAPKAGNQYSIGDIGTQASKFGGKQKGVFAGFNARTANPEKFFEAQQLLDNGVSPTEVYNKTGIIRGADGQLRFEIPDIGQAKIRDAYAIPDSLYDDVMRNAKVTSDNGLFEATYGGSRAFSGSRESALSQLVEAKYLDDIVASDGKLPTRFTPEGLSMYGDYKLSDVLEHPKLFEAYPELKDVNVSGLFDDGALGSWASEQNRIRLNPNDFTGKNYRSNEDLLSTLMHETQHAIQSKEGFGRGYNTESAKAVLDSAKKAQTNLTRQLEDNKSKIALIQNKPSYKKNTELLKTSRMLNEQDRLIGYLKGMENGGKLTDKRRHILNAGSYLLDPNVESNIRAGISWAKRHRPQWEKDAAYQEYIGKVIAESNKSIDDALAKTVRSETVKNPEAKYLRQVENVNKKEIRPIVEEGWKSHGLLDELNPITEHTPESFYRNVGGEAEARLVQERLSPRYAYRNPYQSEVFRQYPLNKQFNISQETGIPENIGILDKLVSEGLIPSNMGIW